MSSEFFNQVKLKLDFVSTRLDTITPLKPTKILDGFKLGKSDPLLEATTIESHPLGLCVCHLYGSTEISEKD